ncbi:hypothetical protein GGH96_002729 [Coemansia sp. RSA 1972]|nr:hypothetical protein GGH96_002729 [Coemansia sp. RSA 1972]
MRVHVLVPLALLFTLQRVAGSPRTVVIDDGDDVDAMFAWETNQQYASESPWPSDEVTSYYSMAPSMNYPVGMADKETSRASSDDTGLFVLSETVDEPSAMDKSMSGGLVETETVFVTLSGADDISESQVIAGSAGSDEHNQNVVVAPIIEVNLSVINGQTQAVTNTIILMLFLSLKLHLQQLEWVQLEQVVLKQLKESKAMAHLAAAVLVVVLVVLV